MKRLLLLLNAVRSALSVSSRHAIRSEMSSFGRSAKVDGSCFRQFDLLLSDSKVGLLTLLLCCFSFAQVNHVENAARLLNQGQLDSAESEARQALKTVDTRAVALSILGTIRLQQHRYRESEDLLTRALAANTHLVGARITLGETYLFENKLPEARNSFQEALRRDPSNFNARYDLAKLETSAQQFEKSLDLLRPLAAQLSTSDEGLLLLATDYASLGKKQELGAIYEKWQQLRSASAEASLDFGTLLNNSGMTEQAKNIFHAAEAKIQANPSALLCLRLARGYLAAGDLDLAEKFAALALSVDAHCAACNLTLAEIAEQQGISEKALAFLLQAKKQDPENPEILFEFGKVCMRRNLVKDAVPALERAVALAPENDSYAYVLASAHVADGNLTRAASLLSQLLHEHPDDALLNYAMGTVYYLQAKYSDAETSLKRSLNAKPDQTAASYYLALTYDARGDDEQATTLLRDLIKRRPDHGLSYVKLGTILVREHRYDEAQTDLEKAISLLPDSVEAHYQLGVLLRRLGKTAESEDQFAQSRKLEDEQRSRLRLQLLLPD
jgi:tetratricopeptide (TPR) repeat protein